MANSSGGFLAEGCGSRGKTVVFVAKASTFQLLSFKGDKASLQQQHDSVLLVCVSPIYKTQKQSSRSNVKRKGILSHYNIFCGLRQRFTGLQAPEV
jgi:hypothetical protein